MTIRILIADDSLLVREVLCGIFQQYPDTCVVGSASNGQEAVELTLSLKPDLVILDLIMPVLDGLETLEEIMAIAPTPVLVLSGAVDESEVDRAFTAIKRGALDVMEKPELDAPGSLEEFAERLHEKVRLLSGIRVIRHPRRRTRYPLEERLEAAAGSTPNILAIGASTGGPKAVMSVLKSLPANFPGTVFVVQHIAAGFAAGFASWLDRECSIKVKLAEDGTRYVPGEALVAPDGCHMTVADGRVHLVDQAPVNCCRPSIDVFFNSLAQAPCDQVVSLLLSGMGKDGALGLLQIKERGGTTLVQDEESCAVFGMPKAAISLCAADQVLPLERMPDTISQLFPLP
ncbi:chemotaxis-specific protein-glutamate methyltransferase CheB [Geomonas sp.]|uniref:chemotaxis-specific protein-glutamate methyltransferase CheB n=1 Tax=Geomonas sp. TaxID=2651584 RepID=UPI002B474A62|nr:chemotaxis-specific protein-glutamate methyltransferase CheB [Geomonas sp.]HJV35291.1 chemotaxis-specific protein-glutamate methyltransferase CheB [Geomonas sp.]